MEFNSASVKINRTHCRNCGHKETWPQVEISGNSTDLMGLLGTLLLAGIGAYALGKLVEALIDSNTKSNRPRTGLYERRYLRTLR